MNSERSGEFPQGEFSSPEDFKLRAPTGSVTLWEGPAGDQVGPEPSAA